MDCRSIKDEDVDFYASYLAQDSRFNPTHFPLIFKTFVVLPDAERDVVAKDYYEIKDETGKVVWCWKNEKSLIKYEDVLTNN